MTRRFSIALVLCTLGSIGYRFLSQGPLRVQLVAVPIHLTFLLTLSWFFWSRRLRLRFPILVLVCMVFSTLSTVLDSFVIDALRPLHVLHFLVGFAGFLFEAVVVISVTWLLDRDVWKLKISGST